MFPQALFTLSRAFLVTVLLLSVYVSAYSCKPPSCSKTHKHGPSVCSSRSSEGKRRSDTVLHVRVTGTSISEPNDCDSSHAEDATTLEVEVLEVLVDGAVGMVQGDSLLVANGEHHPDGVCWTGAFEKMEFEEGLRYLMFANAASTSEKFCGEHVDLTMGSWSTRRPIEDPSAKDICQVSCELEHEDDASSLRSCVRGNESMGRCDASKLLMDAQEHVRRDSIRSGRALLQSESDFRM